MIEKRTFGGIVADIIIWIIVGALALSCLMPLMNIVAISLSDNAAVSANLVNIFPIGFNISSYQEIMGDKQFWRSFGISVLRVVLGLSLILFAMLFSGGLIPTFMVVNSLKLTNTIWALILPGAVPLGNVILLMNAFRGVPKSLEEAAMIDGGSQWVILLKVFLPVVKPTLAAVTLFTIVGHWNDYFSALVYITDTANYPLQTYIQQLNVDITEVTDPDKLEQLARISSRTLNSAKIVVSTIPLLMIYPFMQKYFVSGIVVGSVKE